MSIAFFNWESKGKGPFNMYSIWNEKDPEYICDL